MGPATDSPWLALLAAFSLAPLLVHLLLAWQARRPTHVFDDVIGYLGLPLIVLSFMIPLPRGASRVVMGAGVTIGLVSGWRMMRAALRTRASERRVDGSPDGR